MFCIETKDYFARYTGMYNHYFIFVIVDCFLLTVKLSPKLLQGIYPCRL